MTDKPKNLFTGIQPPTRRPWARVVVLLVALALVSGCRATGHDLKQSLEIPARFSGSGTSQLSDCWWLSFEDPVLNGLIDQALADNFSLKAARDRLSQAQAAAHGAGAALTPALEASAGASGARSREDRRTVNNSGYTLGLSASYELDLLGRMRAGRDAAAFDARASGEDLRAAALTLSAQVAGTWYQLVEQYGQLDVLNAQILTNTKVLELVTVQLRTGKVGIADMLQQKQLLESNWGEKAQVAARAGVLEHQLAILLGLPPGRRVAPRVTTLLVLPPMPETGLPAELVRRRPDIRSAYYRVKAADNDLAAAVANRFPRLSLAAQADTSAEHTRDLFDNWLATLAANLVAPVIDGGLRKAEVDRTRAAAFQVLHTYGQTIIEALGEVEDALVQERRQRDVLTSLDRQLTLAGQVVERVRDRYLQGAVDYQRVLDALLSQQALQRSLLSANRALVQNRIDLCRALGGGWELEAPEEKQSAGKSVPETGDRRFSG